MTSALKQLLATLLLVFALLGLGYPGATQPLPSLATTTALSGHLDHAPGGDTLRLRIGTQLLKTPLSPTGDFKLLVPGLSQARHGSVSYARQQAVLYLTPGDQLHLTLDFPRFDESLRFTGRGANANNYLAQAFWRFEAGQQPRPQDQLTATTTPGQARQAADAFRAQQLAFLATYGQQHPLPVDFQQLATGHITLQWAKLLLTYPETYLQLAQRAPDLPVDYYAFLRQLPATTFAPSAERSPVDNTMTIQCLRGYGYRLVPTGHLGTDPAVGERLYAQATADLGDTPVRDQAVYRLLGGQLATDLAGVRAAYPAFRKHNRDSTAARGLRQGILAMQDVQPGQAAPAFSLVDATGRTVSLSDFRGKVIFLDFWGTWCAPCLAEMPASEALRQHFAGRDVVFVYLSVNDPKEKWQRMLASRKLGTFQAVHLWSPDLKTAQAYQVSEYPSYYLIGRDGHLLATRAPRPSNTSEAVAAIEQALKP